MAKYLKPDSELGYVEDSAEIEYLKFNNLRHSVLGFMLGDFNEQGVYTIEPDIVSELISMRKFIVDSMDNMEVCHSEIKLDKPISFLVTFEGNKATLSLLELVKFEGNFKLDSGAYSNVNEYILDEVETAGEIDRNLLYRRWNIGEFGGAVLDVFSMDEQTIAKYFGLVNRFKYLMLANTELLKKEEEIEEIEAEYAYNMMQSLKAYPKLNNAVIEKLKYNIKEKKGIIKMEKPNFVKTVNEVIDSAIEENISVLTKEERQAFEVDKRNSRLLHTQKVKQVVEVKTERIGKRAENESSIVVLNTHADIEHISLAQAKEQFDKQQHIIEERITQKLTKGEGKTSQNQETKLNEKPYTDRFVDMLKRAGVIVNPPKAATPTAEKPKETKKVEKPDVTKAPPSPSWFRKIPDAKPAKVNKPSEPKKSKEEKQTVNSGSSANYVKRLANGGRRRTAEERFKAEGERRKKEVTPTETNPQNELSLNIDAKTLRKIRGLSMSANKTSQVNINEEIRNTDLETGV